jgi:cold shock CspA family protein
MTLAVIKRLVAEQNHGFLENPRKGGKDIFFRIGEIQNPDVTDASILEEGQTLQIVKITKTEKGLRATKWKLP